RFRADHTALRPVVIGGLEICWRCILAGNVCFAPDLCRLFRRHRLYGVVSRHRAVPAEIAAAGIGRLFQKPERVGLYLPAIAGVERWTHPAPFAKPRALRRFTPRQSGRIAQLVEQLTLNQRVQGSSPCAPTIKSST